MMGDWLTILFCLFVLVTAKPAVDKRAKEEITFGNQQNGLKVKRADVSVSSSEDQQGSIEAQDAHRLDGEGSQDEANDEKDFKAAAKAEEVVKLLNTAPPVEPMADNNVEIVSSLDGESSEPSESAMSYESNGVGGAGVDEVKDDVELDTSDDDDILVDTSDVNNDDESTPGVGSTSSRTEEAIKDNPGNNQLPGVSIVDENMDPELLRRYYDNYLQKLYYKSNAYPYIMRYLYRRRRAALPRQLKASKRNRRIKRDLYYPTFDDLDLARRLLETNALYYGGEDQSKNDADVAGFNQLYDGGEYPLSALDTQFERPEDVEYIPYNYPYGDIPYQEEPSYLVENKREFPPLGMLPGERTKKNTFFPVFEEPNTHWGEFVTRKRSRTDDYERLLRLAEALSENSPYQYIDEYEYYRRK